MSHINIGILEFGYHKENVDSLSIIEHVIEYCSKADLCGFKSFWLTEHHNFHRSSPWSSPDILLPLLLGSTDRIRIGTAGVLINYYSPYKVALDYKLLNNLFDNRVDLGFSNGTPALQTIRLLTQRKLRKRSDQYLEKIKETAKLLKEEDYYIKREVMIPPFKGTYPKMFILGSFCHNLPFALENELNFCKSGFHDINSLTEDNSQILEFKRNYQEKWGYLPEIALALPIICGATKTRALEAANSSIHKNIINNIIGTPSYICERIEILLEKYQLNTVVISDKSNDVNLKLETLELLSEKFNLLKI